MMMTLVLEKQNAKKKYHGIVTASYYCTKNDSMIR